MARKPTHEQLYALLNEKYPHIQYVEGEELNIYTNTCNIIRKLYLSSNLRKKEDVYQDIANKMGLSKRTIEHRIKDLSLTR